MSVPSLQFELALTDPFAPTIWGIYGAAVLADVPDAYWRLGEVSGTTAHDSSGNSHSGTYTNSPTLGVSGALNTSIDTAVTLAAASSQYVTISAPTSLNGYSAITVECWYKISALPGAEQVMVSKVQAAGGAGYALGITAGNKLFFAYPYDSGAGVRAWNIWTSTVTPLTGAWTHLAVTLSGTTITLYTNGTASQTAAVSAIFSMTAPQNVNIGAYSDPVNYFNGSLDEVAIYPTALSGTRIAAHFTAAGGTGLSSINRRVYSWSIARGRNDENSQMQTGLATLILDNDDREYEPFYAGSSLYTAYPGAVAPGKRMRCWVDGITRFTGFVEAIECALEGGHNTATLTAVDYCRWLEKAEVDFRTHADSFIRADNAAALGNLDRPTGTAWTNNVTANASPYWIDLGGNRAHLRGFFGGANGWVASYVDTGGVARRQAVEVKVWPPRDPTTFGYTGLFFRANFSAGDFYFAGLMIETPTATPKLVLKRYSGGTVASTTTVDVAFTPGDTLRVHSSYNYSGTTLTRIVVELNDSVVLDAVVNATPAGTQAGIGVISTGIVDASGYFRDFAVWDDTAYDLYTHQMVTAVLDLLAWPSGERAISTGANIAAPLAGEVWVPAVAYLNEPLDTSETGVDVTIGSEFAVGQTIRIGSEWMNISAITNDTLTVTRGFAGSTAATHEQGDAIALSTWAANPTPGPALDLLQAMAAAEGGAFYISKAGTVVFEGASTRSTQSRSTTAQATFGPNYIPIAGPLVYVSREADLVNRVVASRDGGPEVTIEDTASQTDYLLGVAAFTGLLVRDDTAAAGVARAYLNHHAIPRPRFRTVTVNVNTASDTSALLNRELSDAVALGVHQPHGGTDISQTVLIERMEDNYAGGRYDLAFTLLPREVSQFWILEDAVMGVLGRTTILAP